MKFTLTARLVITTVLLAAVVCLTIAATVTLTMRSSLMDRLDQDVRDLASAYSRPGPGGGPDGSTQNGFGRVGPGNLSVFVSDDGDVSGGIVRPVMDSSTGFFITLDDDEVAQLQDLPENQYVTVSIGDRGRFRVVRIQATRTSYPGFDTTDGSLVVGIPTDDVDSTIKSLVLTEAALTGGGVVLAGLAGFVVVRRQLRPLREVAATAHAVAEQPLSTGEVKMTSRVPDNLTDDHDEVGQVGSALNTLLDHVEESLSARHRSEQQVRQFVADASHELRTPLTTIRGYTELARAHPEDTGATETALAKITEESGRMTTLVEDLLLLARLDQGRPLEKEPVDLSRLLIEAVNDARVVAPEHLWRFDAPAEEVTVIGDEARLHQVIANLLTNARNHTPAGTTITVSVRPDGFDVHDDGPGFPAELVPVAFERFTRGEESRQRSTADQGSGLGLSLVRAIVAAHGGSVSLTSVPGDTTIAIRLPHPT